ncbi:hypothetical protein QEN19_000069 [Hanseniaspora menglaensis]
MEKGKNSRNGLKKWKPNNIGSFNSMKKSKSKVNKKEKILENEIVDSIMEIDTSLMRTDSESELNNTNMKNTTVDESLKDIKIISSPSKRTLQGANKHAIPRSLNQNKDLSFKNEFMKSENRSNSVDRSLDDVFKSLRDKKKIGNDKFESSFNNEPIDTKDLDFMIQEDNTTNKQNTLNSLEQFNKYKDGRNNRDLHPKLVERIDKDFVDLSMDVGKKKVETETINSFNNEILEGKTDKKDINSDGPTKREASDVKISVNLNILKLHYMSASKFSISILKKSEENKLGISFDTSSFILKIYKNNSVEISYNKVSSFSYKSDFQRVVIEFTKPIILEIKESTTNSSICLKKRIPTVCIEFTPNESLKNQMIHILNDKFKKCNPNIEVNENFGIAFITMLRNKYGLEDASETKNSHSLALLERNKKFKSLKNKTYNSLTKQHSVQKDGTSYNKNGNKISSPLSGINKVERAEIATISNGSSSRISKNGINADAFFAKTQTNIKTNTDPLKTEKQELKTTSENLETNKKDESMPSLNRITRSQTGNLFSSKRKYTEFYDDTEFEKTHPLDMDLKHYFSDGSSLKIHDKDFQCLFNGQWLNGTLIDFFNKFFKDETLKLQTTPQLKDLVDDLNYEKPEDIDIKTIIDDEKQDNTKKLTMIKNDENISTNGNSTTQKVADNNFYIFSSYFFLTLDNYENVAKSRWLLKDDCAIMKKHKYHIIPVNLNYHWFGCILENFYEKCLETKEILLEFDKQKVKEEEAFKLKENKIHEKEKELETASEVSEAKELLLDDKEFIENVRANTRSTRNTLKHILNNRNNSGNQKKASEIKKKDLPKITIYVFDSLRNLHQKELQPIKNFLILFAENNFNLKLHPSQIKWKNSQVIMQPNMNDCGVHLISNIKTFMTQTEKTLEFWNMSSFSGNNPELISFFKETYIRTSRKPLRDVLLNLLKIAKTKKDHNNIAIDPIKTDYNSDMEDDELVIIKNESTRKKKKMDISGSMATEKDTKNNKSDNDFNISAIQATQFPNIEKSNNDEEKNGINDKLKAVFENSDNDKNDVNICDLNPNLDDKIKSTEKIFKVEENIDLDYFDKFRDIHPNESTEILLANKSEARVSSSFGNLPILRLNRKDINHLSETEDVPANEHILFETNTNSGKKSSEEDNSFFRKSKRHSRVKTYKG